MDLLGDIGAADQLSSCRTENKVLHEKVNELSLTIRELMADNTKLTAELEVYREIAESSKDDCKLSNCSINEEDVFVRSGNGIYSNTPVVTFEKPHNHSNPLCCALNSDDTLLVTGGADNYLTLIQWGSALAPREDAAEKAVESSLRLRLDSPVVCTGFSYQRSVPVIATGSMDGTVQFAAYNSKELKLLNKSLKHEKYIKCLAWSPTSPILASSGADGSVYLSKVNNVDINGEFELETLEQFNFDGPVEALCFLDYGNTLVCYSRGTTYLSYFYLDNQCKQTKQPLNTGSFQDSHVSFTVRSLQPSADFKFLAAATDKSRQIILQPGTSKQVRNLYGHKNEDFSLPKIGWSTSGQYLYGTSQDDSSIIVWDISSSSIVNRLQGHKGQIRDLYSSRLTDTLATVSYDKTAKIWLTN